MKTQIRMALTVLSSTAASANRNQVTIERDLSLKTRDGLILGEPYLETRFARRVVESWATGLGLNARSRRANSASDKVSWTQKLPLWSRPKVFRAPVVFH
jgi:hypothetical protein